MNTPIIDAKLRPPAQGSLLRRERLLDRLNSNASKKLFLIDAHAGSGKTTLAAQFLESRSLKSAWYSLNPHDQNPVQFFDYLTMAVRHVYPKFCRGMEVRSVASVEAWATFIHELQNRVKEPLYIVLDNFECINGAKGVNDFLIYLIQQLPPKVHLIFLCSQAPRFSLTTYRLSNDLFHLRAADLAFVFEEAFGLLKDVFGAAMSRSNIKRIVEETEGWALALVLIGQHMMGCRDLPKPFRKNARLEGYKDCLHEYFLEDILTPRPRPIQELMISSALLPYLSFNELSLYMGAKNAESLFRSFRGSNIPIFPLNGGTEGYRYHNMFRKFLLDKAHEQRSEPDLVHLHKQAAFCLKKNHPVAAVEHYLAAREISEAVSVLEKAGWDLLRRGRYETLKQLLSKIPLEQRGRNPVLAYYLGRMQEIHGDMGEAQAYYHQALEGLDNGAQSARAACGTRMGILECKMDHFNEARTLLTGTLDRLEKVDIREDIAKRLISTHANLAKVYCKLEETQKTSEHLKQAQSLLDLYGKPEDEIVFLQARTLEAVAEGRFPDVLILANKGIDLCERFGFEGTMPIFNHYLAFAHTYMGDFEEARILAERGLSILKDQGVEDCILGALLAGLGHCTLAEGRVREAVRILQESSATFKRSLNFCGQFWNDFTLSMLASRQGNLSEAWDYWRKMERNSRQLGLPLHHGMTLVVEGLLSAMEPAPEKTIEALSKAKAFLAKSRQRMSVFHGLILAIKAYEIIGRQDMAEETFLESTTSRESKEYYYALHYELDWFLPFVERVLQKNPQQRPLWDGNMPEKPLSRVPESHGAVPQNAVPGRASEDEQMDLHFHALGPFRVTAKGQRVPLEKCASKKALTLLRYLFFKRHEGGAVLDEVLELLWPETDPRMTRANLRVALSMLRKVFKLQGSGPRDFPNLIRDGNKLMLILGENGWSDVDEFLSQVKLAGYKEKKTLWSEALKHYEKIVDLYRGDFLSEDLYADWCAMEREYLKDHYTTSLMRMVHCYEQLGNLPDAIGTLYRVLKMDKYREDAYQKLMTLCACSGRKGEMIRAYTLCKKAIEEDLNMELSTDTADLYVRLSSQVLGRARGSIPEIHAVQ